MSRTPIRESLQRLEIDGLVASTKHGWVVREHEPREIVEIYETRAALEGYAVRLASERATPEQLRRLSALEPLVPGSGDLTGIPRERLVDRNDEFHDAVIAAGGNGTLTGLIQKTRTYFFNYRLAHLYTVEELRASADGHRQLIDALHRRDGDAAERIARQHILDALRVILNRLV
jgi:DNA-binding GntR family transcriptional regulator